MTSRVRWPITLNELRAACDESQRYGLSDWISTRMLSGSMQDRSATRLRQMMADGHVEGRKDGTTRQGQWRWRITAAGRAALAAHFTLA